MTTHDEHNFDRSLTQALENASRWEGSPQAVFQGVRRKLRTEPRKPRLMRSVTVAATALSLVLAVGIYRYLGTSATPAVPADGTPSLAGQKPAVSTALPLVGTEEKLKALTERPRLYPYGVLEATKSLELRASAAGNADYSATNTQVQGVDEADIVKTDGQYLYQTRGTEITISRIHPYEQMGVVSRFELPGSAYAQDLYLDDQYLTVLAVDGYHAKRSLYVPPDTRLLVYDITDKAAPRQVREVAVEGSILSSRKVGPVVYLVAQKPLYAAEEKPSVRYLDSVRGKEQQEIGLEGIRYFPNTHYESFLTVLALDVSDGTKEANVNVYLGSGRNVFMSKDNLYLAFETWDASAMPGSGPQTQIYKFNASGSDVSYQGKGEVPGSILNQFSMDEHNGYFRIATTSQENGMASNVYVLDRNMRITGTLEGLAPGEQIYSVRFMGDKGYLVTFELIDPLFVIDLQDPVNPRVLGELKIPGFSNYLHPLDDTTLLGIGRDTDVVYMDNRPMVQQKGIKLAIFDVSDVHNPRELHVEIIGDEYSHSEALWNHKAVLFYDNILSLPAFLSDKHTTFQGALVYQVGKQSGFTSLGRITHDTGKKPDDNSEYGSRDVNRSLIVNNTFYTVSNAYVKANRLTNSLPELSTLPLN